MAWPRRTQSRQTVWEVVGTGPSAETKQSKPFSSIHSRRNMAGKPHKASRQRGGSEMADLFVVRPLELHEHALPVDAARPLRDFRLELLEA